jgi:hypothetical protein
MEEILVPIILKSSWAQTEAEWNGKDKSFRTSLEHHNKHCKLSQSNKIKTNYIQQITVFIDLEDQINKYCYLLHPVGLDFITLPTLKMHGQTQIKFQI